MPHDEHRLRPPAPQGASHRLSAQLAQLRNLAGLTLSAAGQAAGCDKTHLSHIEHGDRTPSEPLILALDVIYGADGLLVSLYEETLGERRRRDYADALRRRGEPTRLLDKASPPSWLPPDDVALPLPDDHSTFVGDGSGPIGVLLGAGSYFTKSWTIRNSGNVHWVDRFLERVGPHGAASLVQTERIVPVPDTAPGQTVALHVVCRAPAVTGTSVAHFKMVFADGRLCWPARYTSGLDLLVITVDGDSCSCVSCSSIGPLEPEHRKARQLYRPAGRRIDPKIDGIG